MSLSQRLRFKIFQRDNFTCQYCGGKPPQIVLEIDHVISKKDGGQDDEINLLTACFACNHGKGAKSVDVEKVSKNSFKKEMTILKEQKEQLAAYYDFLKKKDEYENTKLDVFQQAWQEASNGSSFTEIGLKSINKLLTKYTAEDIFRAIKITWEKTWGENDGSPFSYMCGVLKNLKLERENPEKYLQQKKAYSTRLVIKNNCYGYINEKIFWKWVNDEIDLDVIASKAIELKQWSSLSNFIHNEFYE